MQPKVNVGDNEIPEEIKKAVEEFLANNNVSEIDKVGVSIDEDGNLVRDENGKIVVSIPSSTPDLCELPAVYNETTRVSEADDKYKEHLETHWGF